MRDLGFDPVRRHASGGGRVIAPAQSALGTRDDAWRCAGCGAEADEQRHTACLCPTAGLFRRSDPDHWRTKGPAMKPIDEQGKLRPEVLAFAWLMERQLRANDHKPGWKRDRAHDLMARVHQEARELGNAVTNYNLNWKGTPEEQRCAVGREAADVANMAMMVADVCHALPVHPPHEEADAPVEEREPYIEALEYYAWELEEVNPHSPRARSLREIKDFIATLPAGAPLVEVERARDPDMISLPREVVEAAVEALNEMGDFAQDARADMVAALSFDARLPKGSEA